MPSIYLFSIFGAIFRVIFDSRVILDLFANFFLDLLILWAEHLCLRFDSLCFEEVFLKLKIRF